MKQKFLFALGYILIASSTWATDYTLTLYADGCSSPNIFICSSGQQLSVSATPMAHRHFVQWNDGNTDNPRLVTMNQNYTYTATFAPDSFNISLSASPTSYGSVSGAGRYQYNSTARLSATANYGYKFSKWNDGNTSNPRTVTVTKDQTYTATFVKQSYSISAYSSNSSWGSVSGAGTYDYLTSVTLTATSNYGYHFVQWNDGNTNSTRTISVTESKSYTATFAKNTYTISATSNNTTYGTVSGGGSALYLSSKQLTATAKYGYHFVKWNDGNTTNPRSITVERDSSFVAEFALNQYQCDATCDNTRGSVSVNGENPLNANFTINLKDSYGDGWEGNKLTITDGAHSYNCTVSSGRTATYNITYYGMPYTFYWTKGSNSNECSFEVTCNGKTYSVTSLSSYKTGDAIPLTGGQSGFDYQSQVTLTATPKYGYHFTKWSDNRTNNPRAFTITKDTTFAALFDPNTYTIQTSVADTACGYTIGDTTVAYLSSVDIQAIPNYGYLFNRWSDGKSSNPRTISVTRDSSFQATFTKKYFSLRVTTTNSSQGFVSGAGSYQYLSEQTISATPEYGYHFDSWSDGNTENPRTVTLLSDTTFTAVFAPDTFSLTILYNDTMGTVTGAGMYAYGDTAYINSTPNYGYKFKALWYNGRSYNYQNATLQITKNDTVTIEFENAEFHVYGYGQNGRVTGTGNYLYLDSATITAKPYVGYLFDSWSDGVTDNPRAIQVTGDTTFTALYVMQYEGVCGENLTWQYRDGLLTISGIGDMYHYDYREDYYEAVIRPWRLFRDSIEKVVIEHGVTSIGQSAFYGLQNRAFTKVVMPQSVKSIGYWAFAECKRLTSVVFSSDLEEVGDYAFQNCTRINDMTCYATVTPDAYEHTFEGVNTMAYLFVQAGSARTYKLDPIWGVFDIHEIGADSITVTGNGVLVEPSDNEAVFTWPMSDGASTYSLNITKDGVVFCVLTFNANGQLIGIAFAPGRADVQHAPAAELTAIGGMTFTVTGLNSATAYAFTFDAKDSSQNVIASYQGIFATTGYVEQNPDTPTSVDHLQHDGVQIQKILRDGVLYILTPDGTFDATGRRVEE